MTALAALFKFLMSPIGRLIGTAVICLAVGTATGWRAHKKISDLAWYKARVAALELNIKARDKAAKADTEKAVADAVEQTRLDTLAQAATAAAGDRQCLGDDVSGRLRELWPGDGKGRRTPTRTR